MSVGGSHSHLEKEDLEAHLEILFSLIFTWSSGFMFGSLL